MKTKYHSSVARRHALATQRGVSMIELMIAMVIGLFLVGGAITVFMQTGNTYRTSDKVARLQEIGRYALDVVETDVRHAGMWGNTMYMPGGGGNITNTVADTIIAPNCGANWIGDVANYIEGRDNGAKLTNPCPASNTGSDAIVIRRSGVATTVLDANKIQLQSNRTSATIFTGATVMDTTVAQISDLVVRAYYITQATASDPFVLTRRTLSGAAGAFKFNEEPVISGIQDLQVQFGVDSDFDNQADQYVDAGAVAGRRIVSARIWILVVADDSEGDFTDPVVYAYANRDYGAAFTDKRRRVLLTKTIQVRNARLL